MKDLSQTDVRKRKPQETRWDKGSKIPKYTVKDSVFTSLFQDKKYLIQLYRTLHPEDKETTEDGLRDITIKNVLTDGIYNDLGFMAGDRLMILVEAQSTWTMNIILRALLYLAQTYQDYFDTQDADLYGSRKIKVPKPELYVIFTGERAEKPERISFSEEFFNGEKCALEVTVKMLYGEPFRKETDRGQKTELDIVSQYILFTKVYQEQLKKYKRTKKTITETIRICKGQNVLKEYLESREREVVDIMGTLFDEERIMQIHIRNVVKEKTEEAVKEAVKKAEEEARIATEKAIKKAVKKAVKDAVKDAEKAEKEAVEKAARDTEKTAAEKAAEKMLKTGKLTEEEIADCFTALSVEDVRRIKEKML